MIDAAKKPPARTDPSWRAIIVRLIGLGVLLIAAATFIASFASWFWFADLFVHFRIQYCVVLVLLAALLLILRCWKLLLICVVCLVLNGMPLWPYLRPANNVSANTNQQTVNRILSLNLLTSNREYDAVRNLILECRPDFVALMETNERWEEALLPLSEKYPYSQFVHRPGNFGIAFLSSRPWSRLEIVETPPLNLPSLMIEFEFGTDNHLQIVATHPVPPLGSQPTIARDEQLLQVAETVYHDSPALMIGDFNMTPWSPRFKWILERGAMDSGGLTDSGLGFGVWPTWHVFPGLLGGLRLDHILLNSHVQPLAHRIVPDVGSDHRGVLVEFSLQPRH